MSGAAGIDGRDKLIPIQALRALAAAMVLFGHLQTEVGQHREGFQALDYAWGAGVDVFFVISGLIMVISSQPYFGQPTGPATFMTRRLIRVVPIYWFYTTLAVLAVLLVPDRLNSMRWDPVVVAASYAFWPVYRWDGEIAPLLGLGWTLNYEMFFYVLFAATLWIRPKRAAAGALIALMAGLAILGSLFEFRPAPLAFWLDDIIIEFVFGILLGWFYLARPDLRSLWWLSALVAGFILLGMTETFSHLPRFIERGIPAALIVAGCLWGFQPRADRVLKPVADWLGESSYSLYLSHPFSVGMIVLLWPFSTAAADWALVLVLVAMIGALAAGIISHRLIERPVTRFLQARVRVARPAVSAA